MLVFDLGCEAGYVKVVRKVHKSVILDTRREVIKARKTSRKQNEKVQAGLDKKFVTLSWKMDIVEDKQPNEGDNSSDTVTSAISTVTLNTGDVAYSVDPIIKMENISKLPMYWNWNYVPRNYVVHEDEERKHCPYFDEDTFVKDPEFIEDLDEHFNSDEEYIEIGDPSVFYETLTRLHELEKKYRNQNSDEMWKEMMKDTTIKRKPFSSEEACEGLDTIMTFPEKKNFKATKPEDIFTPSMASFVAFSKVTGFGPPQKLKEKFLSILKERNATIKNLHIPGPNLDYADNKIAYVRSVSLDSYRQMFCRGALKSASIDLYNQLLPRSNKKTRTSYCYSGSQSNRHHKTNPLFKFHFRDEKFSLFRKCYIFNCTTHIPDDVAPEYIPKKENPKFIETRIPCAPKCYIHDDKSDNAKMSLRSAGCLRWDWKEDELLKNWGPNDVSLCRVLLDVFPDNFCHIAKIMFTSCRKVREYVESEKPELLISETVNDGGTSYTGKKSKSRIGIKSGKSTNKSCPKGMSSHERFLKTIYKPCFHPGMPCDATSECTCIETRTPCEKYCSCPRNCIHRAKGCCCTGKCDTRTCPCFSANRECDPDLCTSCGSHQFNLDRVTCWNIGIQRGLRKHTKIAVSNIPDAGWGIFAAEGIGKNEFICEYTGELISTYEADRRALEYQKRCHTFLFELNEDFSIDAVRKGSKLRFANHADVPNTSVKIMKVNTDHRIGTAHFNTQNWRFSFDFNFKLEKTS